MDEALLRELVPAVIGVLVRRGADFASAEDAVQEALIRALATWPAGPPRDPKGWLVTAAWHRYLDAVRAEAARRGREAAVDAQPPPGPVPSGDDTLHLYFLCANPVLPAPAAVALTLRAVGGLTTRQIAAAYLVPEATMAQRISRAKRRLAGLALDRPGDLRTVLRVLYLVFNEGYGGDVDLAAEAIRLTRQLAALSATRAPDRAAEAAPATRPEGRRQAATERPAATGPQDGGRTAERDADRAAAVRPGPEPEVAGLLALMLLHHARRDSRSGPGGRLVPLAEQDRSRWDRAMIAEGVAVLQAALATDRLGEYQAQAAIAALHADARTARETDWVQIVEWYDELLALTGDSPVVRLNRAVAVGEADGARAGLAALERLDPGLPRFTAVRAYLHEKGGDRELAARLYAAAAREATSVPEREHLTREAARVRQG